MLTVVANLKGGTGKSTVTFNLAVWLASAQRKVTLFDLDPQQTLSDVTQVRTEEGFTPRLNLLSSSHKFVERANVLRMLGREVLVDVGTADMEGMRLALANADRIVAPVGPSQADIWSTQRFLRIVADAAGDKPPNVLGFVNRADIQNGLREAVEAEMALAELPGLTLLDVRWCQRIDYLHAFSEGLAVFELDPEGKAAHEVITLAQLLYP